MKAYNQQIFLTEIEETILFMIIYDYPISEIATYIKRSTINVNHIISDNLCRKFSVEPSDTKFLVDKAVSMGYSIVIPDAILKSKLHV